LPILVQSTYSTLTRYNVAETTGQIALTVANQNYIQQIHKLP